MFVNDSVSVSSFLLLLARPIIISVSKECNMNIVILHVIAANYTPVIKYKMSRFMRKNAFVYAKTKAQISSAVTAQIASALVFAT